MAEPTHRFEDIFQAVSDQLLATVGHILFTVSYTLPSGREVERIFTNMPAQYPTGGRKPVHHSDWNDIMATGKCFVASTPAEFGPHFQDLDTIVALGFGAVVNVPVLQGRRLFGSLNLLDRAGAYRGEVQKACDTVRELALQGFVAYEKHLSTHAAKSK